MAAPQQHPLTNTSCTFSTSAAAFPSTAGNYGSGKPAFCGNLHGQVSVANDIHVQSLVCSTATVVSQPIQSHSASGKTKPCSLCGTAAQRSQSSLVPNSPVSPQEQPVVLLHRLEDGLPEGDVDSLRAFGTIRLLPVHRHSRKGEAVTDDCKHKCDRNHQSVTSHTMAPANLAYKSFKRGNIKKPSELPAGSHSYGDLNESLTSKILRKFKASEDHHTLREKLCENLKNNTSTEKSEVDSSGAGHRRKKNTEARVCENSVESRLDRKDKTHGARFRTASSHHNNPHYSTVSSLSSVSQSSHRVTSPQPQTFSSQADTLDRSGTNRSPLSSLNNLSSPQTSTSFTNYNHSHDSTSLSCRSPDIIHQRSTSPDTPMSVVCSPVVPLMTTALSSPSQNVGSPSAISPPQSPPSPPSPFSPPFMCSPSIYDRENLHSSCSTDLQPSSSPYSPCTLPSLPASPNSLPSSSEYAPSPAPSIDSPPVSPASSSDQQCEISDSQTPRPCSERLYGDPDADETDSAGQLDTVLKWKVKPEISRSRDDKVVPQCHLNIVSSMENVEEVSNKSYMDEKKVTQVSSASETVQLHVPEDISNALQNSATKVQAYSYLQNSVNCECGDGEKNANEAEHLSPNFEECSSDSEIKSESKSVEVEKNCSDSRNSLMKLVLKVKHPANQQLPVGAEKKEYNKENGIPKIVLTLRGNGPNKEYSCSNRLRNESESVNNKKHKSKRNKRQKEKIKKAMKGGKHKRHVELFGEDSNDSCDTIPVNIKNHTSGERHSKIPSTDEQKLCASLTPPTTEEVSSVHSESDLPPTRSPKELPSHCAKDEEVAETMDSAPSPVDESLSHSLLSDVPEINTGIEDRTKNRPSTENSEVNKSQTKCTENNTHEAFEITVEVPEIRDEELPCSESQQKETSQASTVMQHSSSEVDHHDKQAEGITRRRRRSRHAKNTKSGRNSDACLWVSFGVNAPLPLPATDLPSLEPLFTCKEKTKLKETETDDSKALSLSNQRPGEVVEKPLPMANHNERKEREKIEVGLDVNELAEQDNEGKDKLFTGNSECITDSSHSYHKFNSSHEESNGARSRIRSHGDSTHHRSRHSHKRPRKSDDDREEEVKKEIESCQNNPLDAMRQEISTDSCKEKSAISDLTQVCAQEDDKIEIKEKSVTKEPSTFPEVLSNVNNNKHEAKDECKGISQSEESDASNEVTAQQERPMNLKIEETPDEQYYRPKKIRKTFNYKMITNHYNETTFSDQKMTKDHYNEKTFKDQPEDCKAQVPETLEESNKSYKDDVSLKVSPPEAVTNVSSSGMHALESDPSSVDCHISDIKVGTHWRPHEEVIRRDVQPKTLQDNDTSNERRKRKHRSPTPQEQDHVTRMSEESVDEQSKHPVEEMKDEATDKSFRKDCRPGNKDNEKQEVSKKEKEKRKKSRKEKKKDNSRPGSRCSVLQEAQFRREVEHEEGRGRRLAQEIKGFNWLEQKIKNNSLFSSRSVPSTPTTSSSAKELQPISKSLSTPPTTPSTHFTFGNKEEEHARKNSFSGSSVGIGIKRHLQTAVPPLVPSYKVTALPKRRQSQGTPPTPPCAVPSYLCSSTSVPSMTIPAALYTSGPTQYRSGHGRTAPNLERSSSGLGQAESDKATLYSSISPTKATLYGVKDNSLETLYDTVRVNAVNYYGSAASSNIDTGYNIATPPPISFYGSTKYQEPDLHPHKTSSVGSHANFSIVSTSHESSGMTDQVDKVHSPKSDICSSRNSDWSSRQGSSPNNNSHHSGYSVDSNSPQRFSHKQVLLKRAFQEMLKSDPNTSSTEQTMEKVCVVQNIPTKTEMNMADESKCKDTKTSDFTTGQSPSESTPPVDTKSLQYQCPDSSPSLLSNKLSSETTETHVFSYSPESVAASVNSEKDLIDPVCTESKISTSATDISEKAENFACKLDSNNKIVKSESDPNIKENYNDMEKVKEDKNGNITENSKDQQSNVIDCIDNASADIDMKVLKEEICYKGDGKSKEDAEVQPSLLLSVLYKELMKTRQEVEKLRKVQELMLTEKEEKKEDTVEQNSENKMECEKIDENSYSNERILEKRKDHDISDDVELKIDCDEFHYHESKRSKISIRSDLLPKGDSIALDTTSSDIPASQKNISQVHPSSSPTPTNPSQVQSNLEVSVTLSEGSAVSDTSHPSRGSPVIPASSPDLSSNICFAPKITTSLPRGQPSTSPGVSSSGISRSSPGIPKHSPTITRVASAISKSNTGNPMVSPGTLVSPAIPSSSPGIARNSPGAPRSSPGVLRMSPGLPWMHCGMPRISPGTPRISPGAPMGSPGAQKISPGAPMVSPGASRISPGAPRISPGAPMISPGAPMISPGASRISPGTQRISPGAPMVSPGAPRISPGTPMLSPGAPRISPDVPVDSPDSSRNGLGLKRNDSEVIIMNPGISQMSTSSTQKNMFNPPTNPSSTENLHTPHSHSAVTTTQPTIATVQSITSQVPQIPIMSTPVPVISPTAIRTNCPVSRISPTISKNDTATTVLLNKTGTPLTSMSPTRLRSVFGISNSEVELMPVPAAAKQPFHKPQTQTFLNLVEDQHHQTTETPLLLNAVQGAHQESGSKSVESSSSHGHGPVSFHNLGVLQDPKRMSKTHQYVGEMKRHAFSTSDLPDHASSACKQPPPLKPPSLLRRHSDNVDIHSVMHQQAIYSATRKNLASSLHSSAAAAELKNANSVHAFNHPHYSRTQYPLPNPRGRSSDNNSAERNRAYQQAVSMGMQHHLHLPPGSSVMRSLGPDKATIFPIPPTIPPGMRPFRPTTPPSVTRAQMEHFHNENFYRTNFSFFEKIREKFAQPCDNGVNAMDRLQASTANVEKPLQPQTFAPRVLVRESIPEASSHIPTTTFASLHFPNQNQPPHNVMSSHQNHFLTNMHSGPSLHHIAQARLHNQATSSMQRANSSSARSGEKLCFNCPQQARFICSGCKKAWYCTEQCQREHWTIHSAACVL